MTAENRGANLVIATRNRHKMSEIRQILQKYVPELAREKVQCAADYDLPEPVEDGANFAENALIKARALARALQLPALADDSGLCVDILGGTPGIFSARWAGVHGNDQLNLDLLLAQLAQVPPPQRGANFTCCVALVVPGKGEFTALGQVAGVLRKESAGSAGFGYDPIFEPLGTGKTLAEMSAAEKNQLSHRARALEKIAPQIMQHVLGCAFETF